MGVVLTDQPGKTSWPITGATFILMHKEQEKPENGKEVLKFFDWAFKNGDKMADELDYVPMPDAGGEADPGRAGRRRSRTRPARRSTERCSVDRGMSARAG